MSDETPRNLHRSVARTMIDLEDSDEPKVYVGAAGKAPYTLGSGLLSDEDEDEEEAPEQDDEDRCDPEIMEHNNAYKEDYAKRLRCDEDYGEDVLGVPDLASYFANFSLPNFSIIAICRTYANYLAQQERSKRPTIKRIKVRK